MSEAPMFSRVGQWVRGRRKTALVIALALVLAAINFLSYRHAYAMTHFVAGGERTPNPETLTFAQKVGVVLSGVQIPKPLSRRTPRDLGLPFEVQSFTSADGTGLEAWFIPCPDAKGLVLLFHGYASCKANILPEAEAFHDMGYATLLTDFRGSGGSGGSQTTIGVREADDVAAAVAHARGMWPQWSPVLYGQSMGSAAILRAIAVDGVDPEAIIIENPFDRLTSTVANRFATMGLPSFPFAQLLVFWGGVQCGFNGFRHNPVDYARAVHSPALMLHGDRDLRVSRVQAQTIFDNLASARKTFRVLSAGHESLLTTCPAEWTQAVSELLGGK